jgi:YD repeat-containing protein
MVERAGLAPRDLDAVAYSYDPAGRLESLSDWEGRPTTFDYDPDGNRTGIARPNGVSSAYTYDSAGQVTSISHANGQEALQQFSYTYDQDGNRTSVTTTDGTETYTLDAMSRLTEVSYPDGNTFTLRDPYSFLPTLGELDRMLLLRRVPLFGQLGPEDLQRIAAAATERAYPAGEVIVRDLGSTNGTYVSNADQPAIYLRRGELPLFGTGSISKRAVVNPAYPHPFERTRHDCRADPRRDQCDDRNHLNGFLPHIGNDIHLPKQTHDQVVERRAVLTGKHDK